MARMRTSTAACALPLLHAWPMKTFHHVVSDLTASHHKDCLCYCVNGPRSDEDDIAVHMLASNVPRLQTWRGSLTSRGQLGQRTRSRSSITCTGCMIQVNGHTAVQTSCTTLERLAIAIGVTALSETYHNNNVQCYHSLQCADLLDAPLSMLIDCPTCPSYAP